MSTSVGDNATMASARRADVRFELLCDSILFMLLSFDGGGECEYVRERHAIVRESFDSFSILHT